MPPRSDPARGRDGGDARVGRAAQAVAATTHARNLAIMAGVGSSAKSSALTVHRNPIPLRSLNRLATFRRRAPALIKLSALAAGAPPTYSVQSLGPAD